MSLRLARPRIGWQTVLWSLLFPVLWLAYTLVRGAIWKWYPYPFLDVPAHGYAGVAVNCVLVTLVLGVVAALFAAGDRLLPAVPGHSHDAHGQPRAAGSVPGRL